MTYRLGLAASLTATLFTLAACGSSAEQTLKNDQSAAEAPVTLKVPAGVYALDPTHGSLQWSLLHMGLSHYTARFDALQGEITLDPSNLSKSTVSVSIDPKSVNAYFPAAMYKAAQGESGFASWSEDIANNPLYLNAKAFPTITFKSTAVAQTGARTADVTGDLTLLGTSKPVKLAVTFVGELEKHPFAQQPAIGFSAEGRFKRSDFGLAKHLPAEAIGDEVTIRFEGEFIKAAASGTAAH